MILDATDLDRSRFEEVFDICIVGTGPAGMTLARSLAARGLSVALMEGGGRDFTDASQDIYLGEIAGDVYDPLDVARLRYFGGSSNHWGGVCRPLDASDFEVREHVPLSGWPFARAELDPYIPQTEEILDLAPEAEHPDGAVEQDEERFFVPAFRVGEPVTRFAQKYGDEIAALPNVALVLNANLVDLRLDGDLARVEGAVFRTFAPDDPGFTVRARRYALCCGGIENPRLLLNFASQVPAGIGNQNDQVGRYFCEHPHLRIGEVIYERPQTFDPRAMAGEEREIYAPTEAFAAANRVLNFSLPIVPWPREGYLSLTGELARTVPCAADFTQRLTEAVIGRSFDCDGRGIGRYMAESPDTVQWAHLRVHTEQMLHPDSRVMLGEERDALGLMRTRFHWKLHDLDYETMRFAVTAIGAHLAEQGVGRVRMRPWLMEEDVVLPGRDGMEGPTDMHRIGGHHHMCTTRMSTNPREGVVDANCRVHGVENLYIGGSSVFATPGYANPTFTVVQMALRLGDHLARVSAS